MRRGGGRLTEVHLMSLQSVLHLHGMNNDPVTDLQILFGRSLRTVLIRGGVGQHNLDSLIIGRLDRDLSIGQRGDGAHDMDHATVSVDQDGRTYK